MLKLKVLDNDNVELAASEQGARVSIVYQNKYLKGDKIILECEQKDMYCVIQFEDSMPPAFVFVSNKATFRIPFDNGRDSYSPKSFSGINHAIRSRTATKEEISAYKNLAFNPYDQHGENGFFPHTYANVETRGEAVFASRNAIDGIFENSNHGAYPYQSWGINRDPNAELALDFGREVVIDKIALTLRADFPHDSYWTRAALEFSDGSMEPLSLEKSAEPQHFIIEKRKITWVKLGKLIKAEAESPFPALTQIEVFGTDTMKG